MSGPWITLAARRRMRLAALAGLAAALFSQAAIAIAACKLDSGSAPRGLAAALAAAAEPVPPCHEQAPGADTLCVAHCQASDQTVDKSQVKVPVPPAVAVRAAPFELPKPLPVAFPAKPAPAASPPSRILFQSFLI